MSIILSKKCIDQVAQEAMDSYQENKKAKFTSGSISKHVITMSLASSIGLMTIFLVDLLDMFFLSLLGEVELASAVGYAGTISFFTASIGIGISIAMGALVSKAIGQKKVVLANDYFVNILVLSLVITIPITIIIWAFIPELLSLIGATGKTLKFATDYLQILIPSLPILVVGMSLGAALRAFGDAKLSMYSTLSAGIINAILDPIFIFSLSMNVEGAATASVFARITMLLVAFYPLISKYNMTLRFNFTKFMESLKSILIIALPAILTNVSTPIGTAYTILEMSKFGDSAVAGVSVIGRITPVAFAIVFSVSGAVGPIVGQNLGANNLLRVKQTLSKSFLFVCFVVVIVSIILYLLTSVFISIFQLQDDAIKLMRVFTSFVAITYVFVGAGFIANATFNNLNKSVYAMIINILKATVLQSLLFLWVQNYMVR